MRVKRGRKLVVNERELIDWIEHQADGNTAPTFSNIQTHVVNMLKVLLSTALPSVPCKFGKK